MKVQTYKRLNQMRLGDLKKLSEETQRREKVKLQGLVNSYEECKRKEEVLKKEKEILRTTILETLGEVQSVVTDTHKVTQTVSTSRRVDTLALKRDNLYEKYSTLGAPQITLRVTKRKEEAEIVVPKWFEEDKKITL